jgi:membrane protease YdiL (CAAX protease family)
MTTPAIATPAGASQYVRITTPPMPVQVQEQLSETRSQQARRSVFGAVFASIGMGVVILVVSLFLFSDETASLSQRLMIGSALTVALYVIVAIIVWRQVASGHVRPAYAQGSEDGKAVLIGLGVGLATAVGVVTFNSLLSGAISSDPNMMVLLFERAWLHVGVMLVITVIAAPLVEEFLFRGLLVESLRAKGRTSAVLAGAVAFSLWHLNPAQLRYYIVMGFLLGYLYWRFGLNGSITAHAVFNATLLVFAFAAVSGNAHTETVGAVSVRLPPAWRIVAAPDVVPPFAVDLAAETPTGSGFLVQHVDPPPGTTIPDLASALPPQAKNARAFAIGEGQGTRFTIDESGVTADSIMTMRGSRVYMVTFVSGGSVRAEQQYEQILKSLTFPSL